MWPFPAKKRVVVAAPVAAPSEPAAPRLADHRTAFILLALGGAALASFGIAAISSIVSSVFFALVLTICVYPVRRWLESHGVPRGVATVAVLLVVVGLLAAFVGAMVIAIGQFLTLLPQYEPQLEQWLTSIASWLEGFGIGQTQADAIVAGFQPSAILGWLGAIAGSAAGLISSAVVLLTLLILMASDSSYASTITSGITERRPATGTAMLRFTDGVRRYMVATTALGVAQGIVNWIALTIMGIPGALLWGLLSFLCSFIPNVGYFIALVPPLVFGALTGGWPMVVAVIVVYGIFNAVIQSVIQPKVVGNAVSLNQTITFVSVLFWAVILGPMGAILAVPLTLLVRMLLIDSDPRTDWLKPALGEVQGAKKQMEAEDAEAKARRKATRAAKKA